MGRKAKPKMTKKAMEKLVISKYHDRVPMTLEEASLALHIWDKNHTDGYKAKKPMTRMGFLKLENRVMQKLRAELENHGYSKEDFIGMLSESRRQNATVNYGNAVVD